MSSATVTPSLVILGEPQPLSSTALRPRGPRVLRTARASFATPAASGCRASSSKTIFLGTAGFLLLLPNVEAGVKLGRFYLLESGWRTNHSRSSKAANHRQQSGR